MTPAGIELATLRFVAHHLTTVPPRSPSFAFIMANICEVGAEFVNITYLNIWGCEVLNSASLKDPNVSHLSALLT